MNTNDLLKRLEEQVPEFTADNLFIDLPYVVLGEFATFLIARMQTFGADDPVVQRSFELLNKLFADCDPATINAIETTLLEQLTDHAELRRAASALLSDKARASLERIAQWAGQDGTSE